MFRFNKKIYTVIFCLSYMQLAFGDDVTPIAVNDSVIEIEAPVDITSFILQPRTGLLSGNYSKGTEVATWNVVLSDSAQIAFRCTPGKYIANNFSTDATSCVFASSEDSLNALLPVVFSYTGSMQMVNSTDNGMNWMVSNEISSNFSGAVIISSSRNIPPGTYTLSYDAAIYIP